MNLIERYPTVSMFLAFFISSCFFAYCSPGEKIISAGIVTLLLIAVGIISVCKFRKSLSKDLRKAISLICCAFVVAAALSFVTFDIYASRIENTGGKTDTVTVTIEECKYSLSYSSSYVVTVTESELLPKGTKLLLTTDKGYMPTGTILQGGVYYLSLSERNHGTFDVKRYYNAKKIMLEAEDTELHNIGMDESFKLSRFFKSINNRLSAMIMAHCDTDAGSLATAVLLGNDEYLSDSISRDYRRIGITHLLVVSGSHFAVLIATADTIWKKLSLKRKTRSVVNIALILLLMCLTGFTPSVVRAGIMHLLAQVSMLLFRKANVLNSLAISGTILVIVNPFVTLDVGMQLSFIAAYCCIMFQMLKGEVLGRIKRKSGLKRKSRIIKMLLTVLETVILTSLINLCTLPITWLYFGEASLLAVLSNIIFIPLITLLMYVTIAYLVLYPLIVFTPILAAVLNVFGGILNWLAGLLASANWAVQSINYPFAVYFLIPICLLLILLPILKSKHRMISLVMATVLVCSMFVTIKVIEYTEKTDIGFTYVTSGKNDGFVVKSDGGALICDISDGSYSFCRKLTDEVTLMHLSEVRALLLTHYHSKHVQLVSRVIENEVLRSILLPEPVDEREEGIYNSVVDVADRAGVEIITVPRGGSFSFGDAIITVYDRTYLSRSTHPITAVKIDMHGEDAVLLSCSFNESKADLLEVPEGAEYLIFGVHSPVYKKTFGLDFSSDPKEIILGGNAYEFMDDALKEYIDSRDTIRDAEVYRVVIKGNT